MDTRIMKTEFHFSKKMSTGMIYCEKLKAESYAHGTGHRNTFDVKALLLLLFA
jgi:hypothetical protein